MKLLAKFGRKNYFILKWSRLFALLPVLFMLTVRSAGQCLPLDMAFGYTPPTECINKVSILRLNYIPMGTIPSEDGIFPGTKYYINWGDGTEVTWYSTAAERVPPPSVRSHEYEGPANCTYEMKSMVTSACDPAYVKNFETRVVIHGRDITEDGDGDLLIEENGTGISGVIQVCEGSVHRITLVDNSTWNCQDPIWPDNSPAPRNDAPRTIQWIYGEDNAGSVFNTIGTTLNPASPDPVLIDGGFSATVSNGYIGAPVVNITATGQLSKSFIIPASCREGEYFDVYLLNWNKCNPYPADAPVYTHIRVLVVAAPGLPVASDRFICAGDDPTLTASEGTPAGNLLTWYAEPEKITVLGTGNTFNPGATDPGTYKYYVASGQTTGDLCNGPAREVTLTIRPIPNQPVINISGSLSFCFDGRTNVILSASTVTPPEVAGYEWYKDGSLLNTNLRNLFDQVNQSGSYTLRAFGPAPSSCPSPLSDPAVVTIYPFATTTDPANKTVCQGSGTTFSITAGGAPGSILWQRKTVTGAWVDITGGTTPNDGCTYSNYTSATLTISNAAAIMNGYQYRAKLTTTAGGCVTWSNAATLTVNPIAAVTVQPVAVTVCELDDASFSVVAGVTAPSTIISYQWQRRMISGGYSNITATTDGGIYSNFNTPVLNISNAPFSIDRYSYQCRITTTGNCSTNSASKTITVVRYANITAQPPDRTVCVGSGTTFPVTDDKVTEVTGHQWQVSADGGSWDNLADGGVYSGVNTATLVLSDITDGYNGYRFRCILVTKGTCPVTSNAGNLTVNPLPDARVLGSVLSDPSICRGQDANITLSNSFAGISYQLRLNSNDTNVGDPQTGAGGALSFNVTPASTTVYNVLARIIVSGCEAELSDRSTVTVNPLPVPVITGINNVCANEAGISYSTPDAGGRSFAWEILGGSITSGQGTGSITVTWGAAGTGWLKVTEKISATGCDGSSANFNVTINPGAPAEKPSLTAGVTDICLNGTIIIDISDVPTAVRYIWDYSWVAGTSNATTTDSRISIDLTGMAPGTYTVTAAGANGCGTGAFMDPGHTFNINAIPDLSALSGVICSDVASEIRLSVTNNDPLYCSGITYDITAINPNGLAASAGSPQTGSGLAADVIADDAWTNTTGSNVNVIYSIIPVSAQGCSGQVENVSLEVSSAPEGADVQAVICSDEALNYNIQTQNINVHGNSQPSTFTWQAIDNAYVTGETTTMQSTEIINDNLNNMTGSTQVVQYIVTPTGINLCAGQSFTVSVTVKPEPDLKELNAEVCSDIPAGIRFACEYGLADIFEIVAITAEEGLIAGPGNASPGPGKFSDAILNDTWTNMTTLPLTVTYAIIPGISGGCTGDQENVTVTVNPEPDLSDLNNTVCSDAPVGITLSDVSGISDMFDIVTVIPEAGLMPGSSNSVPGTGKPAGYISTDSWTNTATEPLKVTYVVIPSINGICYGDPENVVVTVRPPVLPGALTGNTSVCYDTDAPVISNAADATGGDESITYSWYYTEVLSALPGDKNWTLTEGATASTFDPGKLINPTKFIRRAQDGSCTSGAYTNMITILINPLPVTAAITGEDKLCDNATNKIYQVPNTSGSTYTWTVPSSILDETFNAGLYFIMVDAREGSSGTFPVQVVEKITATGCIGLPVKFDVTVSPVLPGDDIAGPQSVCVGDADVSYSVPETDGSTYSWIIPAGASISNNPDGHEIFVTFSMAVTGSISVVETSAGGCTTVHNPKTIVINSLPAVYNLTAPASYCSGDQGVTVTLSGSQTGVLYQLYRDNNPVNVPETGTGSAITWTGMTEGIYTARATKITGSCLREMNGAPAVTVMALPVLTGSPADKAVCEYGATSFSITVEGSDLKYQWFVNNGSTIIPVADEQGIYYGATSSTLNLFGPGRNMDGFVYHAVVTGCGTSITSGSATLTINSNPQIKTQPRDTIVCMNSDAIFKVTAEGTSLNYKWQVNKGSGFEDISGENFNGATTNILTVTNTPVTFNNYIFRIVLTGTCGAPVYSNFVTLKVTGPPKVTLNPVSMEICDGGGPVSFMASGSGMIDSVRWQVYREGAWSDLYDSDIYSGTASWQLTLNKIFPEFNNNKYRLAYRSRCWNVYTDDAMLTVNTNPVVIFSPDTIYACGGVPVEIDGNPQGGSGIWGSHLWTGDVGPLNDYSIQAPAFSSKMRGSYDLNYRVRDSKGCSGNDKITVVVDSPGAEFTQTILSGCTPVSVSFSKNMTGILKFSWDFGDGSPADTINGNPVHQYFNSTPASIEYRTVKLTVLSPGGCYDTYSSTVTVYPDVKATFTADKIMVCSGDSIVYTSRPGATRYYWDFGDGISGYTADESTAHLYTNFTNEPVIHTVRLITTSFYECTDEESITITVMPAPQPQFSALPPTQTFDAAGNKVEFSNETGPGNWTYLWRFGDGSRSTLADTDHKYTGTGTFKVTLIAGNSACSDSIMHEVSILPVPPVALFDSIPSGCEPLSINIKNKSVRTEAPGTTYRWDFGDGNFSTARHPVYTYYNPGIYRVELTVTGPGGRSSESQVIEVYPAPRANFDVAPTVVFLNDEKVRMFNLSQGADTYLWEFGDGDTSTLKEPFHKYMTPGVYDITLYAYSNNGCSNMFVLTPAVTVKPAGVLRFSTVFTPNKDGAIERTDLPTGGTEIDQFFFPPIREEVTNYKLQIFNRQGMLIFESRDINIPWNGYYKNHLCPQGVYVWFVEGKYATGMPFRKVGDITLLH